MEEKVTKCSVSKKCGSCQYQGVPYKEQLAAKQKRMKKLLGKFAKAFKQIEWKDAWQVYKDESDVTADFHARREVNQFLSARNRAILLEGFEVPGITVRTAMGKFLLYHQEGDFYE